MVELFVIELLSRVFFINEGDICWFGIEVILEILIIFFGFVEGDNLVGGLFVFVFVGIIVVVFGD